MTKKLRQVTDAIHGTIYLSNLEMDFISTTYFYRLHDIYQSSTVYLTYPCNRTKRYEHSLGAMHLASELLRSCLKNSTDANPADANPADANPADANPADANPETYKNIKNDFFKEIDKKIEIIKEKLQLEFNNIYRKLKNTDSGSIEFERDSYAKWFYDEIVANAHEYKNSEKYEKIKTAISKLPWQSEQGQDGQTIEKLDIPVEKILSESLKNEKFEHNDPAFGYYEFICLDSENKMRFNIFTYHVLLQAIRIVALYHDVGHPPFSHIMEDVLLYFTNINQDIDEKYIPKQYISKYTNQYNKDFGRNLEDYKTIYKQYSDLNLKQKYYLIDTEPTLSKHLHERISLDILSNSIRSIIKEKIEKISRNIYNFSIDEKQETDENQEAENQKLIEKELIDLLYYIFVAEFSISIFSESDQGIFTSLHKIVDGIVDVDRMDYVLRDSLNSGVNWGRIPYNRIIKTAIFSKPPFINNSSDTKEEESKYIIAFPRKVIDDIEDFLVLRYKIFSRINFHHRCIKSEMALQEAVKKLVYLYLINCDVTEGDIAIFWQAINKESGMISKKIIRWNDSWLISTLHKAYVFIKDIKKIISENDENKQKWQDVERIIKHNRLIEDLEEILLSKKSYVSLLKHQADNREFFDRILLDDFQLRIESKTKAKNCKNLEDLKDYFLEYEYQKKIKAEEELNNTYIKMIERLLESDEISKENLDKLKDELDKEINKIQENICSTKEKNEQRLLQIKSDRITAQKESIQEIIKTYDVHQIKDVLEKELDNEKQKENEDKKRITNKIREIDALIENDQDSDDKKKHINEIDELNKEKELYPDIKERNAIEGIKRFSINNLNQLFLKFPLFQESMPNKTENGIFEYGEMTTDTPEYEEYINKKINEKINNNNIDKIIIKLNDKINKYGINPSNTDCFENVYWYDDNKIPKQYEAQKYIIERLKTFANNATWMSVFVKFKDYNKVSEDNTVSKECEEVKKQLEKIIQEELINTLKQSRLYKNHKIIKNSNI